STLHAIFEELVGSKEAVGGEKRKIADIYASFMDSAGIERQGLVPLTAELAAIAALKSPADLPGAFARASRIGVRVPFSVTVQTDQKAATTNVVVVSQGGLGMPD